MLFRLMNNQGGHTIYFHPNGYDIKLSIVQLLRLAIVINI